MPDNQVQSSDPLQDNLNRLTKEFNTNKGFGFEGILNSALEQQQAQLPNGIEQAQQAPQLQQAAPSAPPAPVAPPAAVVPQVTPEQIIDPINTALQGFKNDTANHLRTMQTQISELQKLRAEVPIQTTADGSPDPFVGKLTQQIDALQNQQKSLHRIASQDRAKSALYQVAQRYPDAKLGEEDFNTVWAGNKMDEHPELADGVNWADHWDMVARAKAQPGLVRAMQAEQERARGLEAEVERLKTNRPDPMAAMGSAPRTTRTSGNGLPQNVLMGNQGFQNSGGNEEDAIYTRANEIMGGTNRGKGRFMGFNRALNTALGEVRGQGQYV